jgi:hypothetical protein
MLVHRYRFEFREDFAADEVDGIELEDHESAHREAVRTALEIMAEGIHEGLDRTGWVSRVYDENGDIVATVKFSDLLEKRGHLE